MITYSVANNIITVTGYSEATPCNFTDLYNADKAGTLSLHARTGIAGTDGAGVAVDRAERPADNIVLGGASNDLYITIANWNGTTATIRITGTDRDGAAQTEDIVVNANGAFYTTKWFKTITHTQVTAFTATSFDYDLTQGQWGVVWKQGTGQFYLIASLHIGDGSATYFKDSDKFIEIGSSIIAINFTSSANSNIDLSYTKLIHYNYPSYNIHYGKVTLDKCLVKQGRNWRGFWFRNSSNSVQNSIFWGGWGVFEGGGVLNRCNFYNRQYLMSSNYDINDMIFSMFWFSDAPADPTFKNCIWTITSGDMMSQWGAGAGIMNFIDCTSGSWQFLLANNTCFAWRKYTFNLKVLNPDGTAVSSATIKIYDLNNDLVTDTTTDGNGKITEQTLIYGYAQGPGTVTITNMKTPHTIEIRKAGYKTYKKKFTIDSKTDWTIALQKVLNNNFSKRININNY